MGLMRQNQNNTMVDTVKVEAVFWLGKIYFAQLPEGSSLIFTVRWLSLYIWLKATTYLLWVFCVCLFIFIFVGFVHFLLLGFYECFIVICRTHRISTKLNFERKRRRSSLFTTLWRKIVHSWFKCIVSGGIYLMGTKSCNHIHSLYVIYWFFF